MTAPQDTSREESPVLLDLKHPVEGHLRLAWDAGVVSVECRWPFDLDTGDWIHLSAHVSDEAYAACLAELAATGSGRAEDLARGAIEFSGLPSGGTRFEVWDEASDPPTRLALTLDNAVHATSARLQEALAAGRAAAFSRAAGST